MWLITRVRCPTGKRAPAHLIPHDTPPQPLFSLAPGMEGVRLRLKHLSSPRASVGKDKNLRTSGASTDPSVEKPEVAVSALHPRTHRHQPSRRRSPSLPSACRSSEWGPTRALQCKQQPQRGSCSWDTRERLRGQTAGGCVVPRVRGRVSTSLRVSRHWHVT